MRVPRSSTRRAPRSIAVSGLGVVVAAVLLVSVAITGAAAPSALIDVGASAERPATRLYVPGAMVNVFERNVLSDPVRDRTIAAARSVGASASVGRGFTIGMTRVVRNGTAVQEATGSGGQWRFPMSVTALPLDTIGAVMGFDISAVIAADQLVMGQTTANMRGATAGDTVDLLAASGATITYTIGAVAPDAAVGGTELVMSTAQADALGATIPTRVLIYGAFDRGALDGALAAQGVPSSTIRVRRSWDAPDPDSTLGLAATKVLLGEFDYLIGANDSISIDPAWTAAHIPGRETYAGVGVRAACHNALHADLQAALNEVAAAGLAGLIDLANTNTYGGCFGPRYNRLSGNIGSLSRHTWGQPLDMNTVSNCQGCVPQMDCRIVRIFRAHGFAWGGNFLVPDGMHFEWVGTQGLDRLPYPSKYCPNTVNPAAESLGTQITQRDTFFANDGWTESDPE